MGGDVDVIQALIDSSLASVQLSNSAGDQPLHLAAAAGSVHAIKILLHKGTYMLDKFSTHEI